MSFSYTILLFLLKKISSKRSNLFEIISCNSYYYPLIQFIMKTFTLFLFVIELVRYIMKLPQFNHLLELSAQKSAIKKMNAIFEDS